MSSQPHRDKTHDNATDWTNLVRYQCRSCNAEAINHADLSCTASRECRCCHRVAQLVEDGISLGAPLSRQAGDFLCGEMFLSERSERDSAPGRNARQRSAASSPRTSPGIRSERREVHTRRYANRTVRHWVTSR